MNTITMAVRAAILLSISIRMVWPLSAAADLKIEMLTSTLQLPPGFKMAVYAQDVPGARCLAVSARGTLFVGTRQSGKVYAVIDENGDYKADRVVVIAQGLNMPNGVALWGGDLYVAEIERILRFAQIEFNLENPPKPEVVYDQYPADRFHGSKVIRFGPDGKLYVPVGAPCNACLSQEPIYASLTSIHPDGSNLEIFAHGVRYSQGFDWHPQTGELWFTEQGRIGLGNESPVDELNRAPLKGFHFGFPHCHAGIWPDPELANDQSCQQFSPPVIQLEPQTGAMGMRFYTGRMFPDEYRNQIFIAEHGAWHQDRVIGCRIALVKVKDGRAFAYTSFVQGWQTQGHIWGRPVDLAVMPDGALAISDDVNGVIYRIAYQKLHH